MTPLFLRESESTPKAQERDHLLDPAIEAKVVEEAADFLKLAKEALGETAVVGLLREAEDADPDVPVQEDETQGLREAIFTASLMLAIHGPLQEAGNDPHDKGKEPFSTSTTSNWVARAGGLPTYIQHVAHAMVEKGKDVSKAIGMAVGIVKNWAEGKGGVHPAIKAAAAKAIAEWDAKRAKAKVTEAAVPSWMLPAAALKPGFKPLEPAKPKSPSSTTPSSSSSWASQKHPRGYGGKFVTIGSTGPLAKGALKALPGQVNGSPSTFEVSDRLAVMRFQRAHGLQVDGIVGKQTAAALMGRKNASTVGVGALTERDKNFLVRQAHK